MKKIELRIRDKIPFRMFNELYSSEIFQEHESVIVFTRENINRRYTSIITE